MRTMKVVACEMRRLIANVACDSFTRDDDSMSALCARFASHLGTLHAIW